jgi:orotidine-5'-phosphate decarboxylase
MLRAEDGRFFHEHVIQMSSKWGTLENTMIVTGATNARYLENIRTLIPRHFLLVPGVGAQGGSLEEVVRYGMNENVGLLVNSSRGIIYASTGEDFAEKAGIAAKKLQQEMSYFLAEY